METKRISPLKAIRLKCLDCCCGSSNEVKLCTAERCPLYVFREGKNPYSQKRKYTEEQKKAMAARLRKLNPTVTGEKSANSPSEGKDTTQDIPVKSKAVAQEVCPE